MAGARIEMARRRGPTWFVTARHRRSTLVDGTPTWTPYGVRHARRVGEPRTACGEAALGWVLFWEMPFAPGTDRLCRACCEAVGPAAPAARPHARG